MGSSWVPHSFQKLPPTPTFPTYSLLVTVRQAELSEALKLAGLGTEMALEAAKRLAKGAGAGKDSGNHEVWNTLW